MTSSPEGFFVSRVIKKLRGWHERENSPPIVDSKSSAEPASGLVPVIWLLGKTGAGKSAIVNSLTGGSVALVGNGYRPTTKSTCVYDFPSQSPLVRFMDTRGLGEADYDHVEDVKWHESEASVLMIVMRVSDPDQADIVKLVCDIRTRRSLPVIVVHTCLHESYGDEKNHPVGYPFVGDESDSRNPSIPRELRNRIAYQRQGFKGMKGEPPIFVVIDFSEDFSPTDYGRQALVEATAAAVTSVSDQLLHDMAGVSRLLRLWPFKSKFRYEVHEARVVRRKAQFGARLRDALTGGLGAVR